MKLLIEFAIFAGVICMIYLFTLGPDKQEALEHKNAAQLASNPSKPDNFYHGIYQSTQQQKATQTPSHENLNPYQLQGSASPIHQMAKQEAERIIATGDTAKLEEELRKNEGLLRIMGY